MAVAIVLLLSPCVRADGLIRDGVGAISIGRGGTNIAHSDNAAVLLDNPAGIVNAPGQGLFEAGLDFLTTHIDYSDRDPNNVEAEFAITPVPPIGLVHKSADGRWAVGIGVFFPAGFSAEYDMFNPILGFQRYRSLGLLAKVLPAAAWRVTDRLAVGATLGVGFSQMELDGPFFMQSGPLAGAPTIFDLKANDTTIVWSVGMQYQLNDSTTVGATYTSAADFDLDGKVDVDVFGLGPVPISSQFDTKVDLEWPRSVGVGIVHVHNCRHRISLDVIWYDWSNAFNGLGMRLTNSSNPLFPMLVGPVIKDRFPFDWDDSISVRVGYEYFTDSSGVWRLGYVGHPSPVPDDTLNPYVDGVLEHAVSAGYGRSFGQWQLNAAYQFSFGPDRDVGQSKIVGGDFNNSRLKVQSHWVSFSVLRRF